MYSYKGSYYYLLSVVILLSFSCKTGLPTQNNTESEKARVLYAKNNEGLFVYDYSINKSKKVADLKDVFIPNTIQQINDSVAIIAVEGEDIDDLSYNMKYYEVNLKSGENSKYKVVSYSKEDNTLNVKTDYYSNTGNITNSISKKLKCTKLNIRFKKLKCCNVGEYIATQENTQKIFAFVKAGSLYLNNNDSIMLIDEYTNNYSRRSKSGYSNPYLSSDNKKVVCEYKEGQGVYAKKDIVMFDTETMMKNILISEENYFKPQLSNNYNLLLVGKNKRKDEVDNEWKEDVFLYDITKRYAIDVAVSNNYVWLN